MAQKKSAASSTAVSVAQLHQWTPLTQTDVPHERATKLPTIRRTVDDLYNENRSPAYTFLARFKSVNLTDADGNQYWLAEDVKWNTPFVDGVMRSSEVQPGDMFFWTRPSQPKTQEERAMHRGNPYVAPTADPYTPYIFYHEEKDFIRTLQGYIILSGCDAPSTRTSRKSSWVVVRELVFV